MFDSWKELEHRGTGEEGGRSGAAGIFETASNGGQEDWGNLQNCESGTHALLTEHLDISN